MLAQWTSICDCAFQLRAAEGEGHKYAVGPPQMCPKENFTANANVTANCFLQTRMPGGGNFNRQVTGGAKKPYPKIYIPYKVYTLKFNSCWK